PATATFRVVVSDGTLTDDEEITVTVHNVPPAVQAGADATITAGGTFALSATFSDPGVDDQPWTWLVDWGNGTTSAGSVTSQAAPIAITSPAYATAGAYSVIVTVTDRDGGAGTGSLALTVTPAQPAPTATAACSPGFWGQNGVRRDAWPAGYATTDLVSAVFTNAAGYLGAATLLEALHGYKDVRGRRNTVEGAGEILLRSAVAAILNEASFGAAYPAAGVPAIAATVNAALLSGDRSRILGLAEILDRWNNNLPALAAAYPGLAGTGPVLPSGSCSLPR
ncbi:MAG TPA: PKD domain-containing protein, partial [Longimicrobiales bacterium]|nr:PKD domain-containing protein [Longimicrobiales bacterium]